MRMVLRKAGVACGAAFASVALALTGPAPAMAANSALVVGGIDAPSLSDMILRQLLGGSLRDQDRVSVHWPAQAGPFTGRDDMNLGDAINIGIANLNTQIGTALNRLDNGEKVTVVGLSAGSLVVNEVLRQLAAQADAPDKDQITFILVADSSRQKLIDKTRYNSRLNYTYQKAPETKYDIIVVTGEYDGMADFPDRWWNFLAVANAFAGGMLVHVPMMFADLDDVPAENIEVVVNPLGGTTTHYLVPTKKLPLVQLLPFLADREAELKAMIDKGYSRNDARTGASARKLGTTGVTTPVALPADPESTPVVEEVEAVELEADTAVETPKTEAPKTGSDDVATWSGTGTLVDVAMEVTDDVTGVSEDVAVAPVEVDDDSDKIADEIRTEVESAEADLASELAQESSESDESDTVRATGGGDDTAATTGSKRSGSAAGTSERRGSSKSSARST
ncbi:PE-PPE domain-containing protein [Mycolicibacterium vaccae]|uniref:PE-PPE domain-containing protein n=1 Tax=Mycolicibacterium vaccae TaxID=1810 RepID=UPI003CEEF91A